MCAVDFSRVRVIDGVPQIRGIPLTKILKAAAEGKPTGVSDDEVLEARRFALAAFDDASFPHGVAAQQKGMLKLLSAVTDPDESARTPAPSAGLIEQVVFKDYLVLVQDFRTAVENREACFTLVARETDLDAARARLMNAGQRHPGIVVQVFLTNEARPSRDERPAPLTDFEIWRGAFVVLAHCPSQNNFERMCFNAAYPRDPGSLAKARAAYFDRRVFTLFGCVVFIGDSENPDADGIGMKTGQPMAGALSASG